MSKKIKIGLNKKNSQKMKMLNYSDDISATITNRLPLITLFGNTQTVIDGCFSIIEYEENIIKISVKNGFITFLGNEFKISTFSDEQLSFSGVITSVEFSV